jgi:hypothetical protein
MSDHLKTLQAAERAIRRRYAMGGSANDRAELAEQLDPEQLRPGFLICDCICNCGSIVQVVRTPRKGTNDTLCMTCLELSNRLDPAHRPWPASGVVILPPEKKN